MFWKAIVLALGVALIERYRRSKKEHRTEHGMTLVPKGSRYIATDRYSVAERWGFRIGLIIGVPLLAFGIWDAVSYWNA